MRRLAKAHRSTRNHHLHRNARLGSCRSATMTLGITCASEIVCAFVWRDGGEGFGDSVGDGVEGSGRGFSDEAFDLGEDLLDRVEVGGVFWKEQETPAGGLDRVSHGFAFLRSQIVEHDDVVALEGRDQELFDVGEKPLAVDGTVERAGRVDAVVAQRSQECRRLPMAVRDLGDEPTSARRPTVEPGHVGLGPGLVDEHQSRRIDALLMASPAPAMALYVRTILLARDKRLFLSVTPMRRKKRLIIAVSARTPRSASNRSQSALS